MQLIFVILAAFGLGYWAARSDAIQRLNQTAKSASQRLRRKPETEQAGTTGEQAQPDTEAQTA